MRFLFFDEGTGHDDKSTLWRVLDMEFGVSMIGQIARF